MLFESLSGFASALWVAVTGIPWWFAVIGIAMLVSKPLTKYVKRFTRNHY